MGRLMFTHGKFVKGDLLTDGVKVLGGQYVKLGGYTVLAGEEISPGYGQYDSMENAVGRVYAVLKDSTGTEIKGTYQLVVVSPQNVQLLPLGTWRTEDWNTSASDKTKQIPFARMPVRVTKDKKIELHFMADAGSDGKIVSLDNSDMQMDVTRVLLD